MSGIVTLYFPLFPYKTARLLRVAATAGWFSPRVFSLMAKASLSKFAASLYLFWSLYTRARMFSMVATSGWSCPEVFSRSSKACLHKGTATSYLHQGSVLRLTNGRASLPALTGILDHQVMKGSQPCWNLVTRIGLHGSGISYCLWSSVA